MYTQNEEEKHIVEYFKDYKGALLSIGENDGKTLSNALRLIELGWSAYLVEPSMEAFHKLHRLHKDNKEVTMCRVAIGTKTGKAKFYESGAHFPDKTDHSLLSSLNNDETTRWRNEGVDFKETEVSVLDYKRFVKDVQAPDFDFISIDAEGLDISILKQIDLTNNKLLCIEWNSIPEVKEQILECTSTYGMNKIIYQSPENLILCK